MPCCPTSRKEPGSGKSRMSMTAVPPPLITSRLALEMCPAVLVLLRAHQEGWHPWDPLWVDSLLEGFPL